MKITVFTPTYNRAYILENLYRSLQRQSFRDFEWLIIDDGSTDNTEQLVSGWINEENEFPIRYYKQQNGGKCRAINRALDLAQGELFFVMDSDDYLTDHALERVVFWESTIKDKDKYAGVLGNRGQSEDYSPNRSLGSSFRDISMLERYPEYTKSSVDGERADVWYTSVHRRYKYPEYPGENFMTEAVAWNRMAADGYIVRAFDEIIWICNYLDDGLTKAGSTLFYQNPRGAGLVLKEKSEFLHYPLKRKMKVWYTFYCDHSYCDEQYRLTKKQCAEYIGAPLPFMWAAEAVHRIRTLMKRKK